MRPSDQPSNSGSGTPLRLPVQMQTTTQNTKFDQMWPALETAIKSLLTDPNAVQCLSVGVLQHYIAMLVMDNQGGQLYSSLMQVLKLHVEIHVRAYVLNSLKMPNFLEIFIFVWETHLKSLIAIDSLFAFLRGVFVGHNNPNNVLNQGSVFFRDYVIRDVHIKTHLRAAIVGMVTAERQGNLTTNRNLIKSVCELLVHMSSNLTPQGNEHEDFEVHYLSESLISYRFCSQHLLAKNGISRYIHSVEPLLNMECMRTHECFGEGTAQKMRKIVESELIGMHIKYFVEDNSGLICMLQNKRKDDIECMHRLLSRVPNGLEAMLNCVNKYLSSMGRSIGPGVDVCDTSSFIQSLFSAIEDTGASKT